MPYMADGTVPIGEVLEISGAGSRVAIDLAALRGYADEVDPSLVQAGQVGSLVKIQVGNRWLVANIRTQTLRHANSCFFTMLAVGDDGKPMAVKAFVPQTPGG